MLIRLESLQNKHIGIVDDLPRVMLRIAWLVFENQQCITVAEVLLEKSQDASLAEFLAVSRRTPDVSLETSGLILYLEKSSGFSFDIFNRRKFSVSNRSK